MELDKKKEIREKLTSKERIRKSLAHEEPDRVPLFELAFSTKLASEVLGHQAFFPRSGGLNLKKIIQANMAGRKMRQDMIREGTETQIELYSKIGYDAMYLIPTEYLQPVFGSFGLFGNNYLFDVSIKEIKPNTWKVSSPEGLWSIYRYEERADAFFSMDDSVKRGGIKALRRYVEILESNDKGINEYTKDALESTHIMVERTKSGNLFTLGHSDVCHPNDQAYLPVFLEAMATEPKLIDRFFEATTEGILPILQAQLDMGVDGILGATDWCFKTGPIMSPRMFSRFLVPYLKVIVQTTHRYNKPFIKHLDGNTEKILPLLVDEVGIDAYHAIEPTAGMDICKLKKQYGERLSLWGNIDCSEVLVRGMPKQVREEVKKIISVVAPGGGFVLSSSAAIFDMIPMQNLRAMLEAAREFGDYPIQI